jgi:hypothetical protein
VGEKRNAYKFFVGKPERNNHLEVLSIDVRIILR